MGMLNGAGKELAEHLAPVIDEIANRLERKVDQLADRLDRKIDQLADRLEGLIRDSKLHLTVDLDRKEP